MLKRLTGGGSGLNLDLSGAALKGMAQAVWQDLKAKRLWPVAVLLLLGVVAVPVLLSKSATTPTPPPAPIMPPAAPGLPAVTQRLLLPSQLKGTKRDPFTPQAGVASASSPASSSTSSPPASGSTGTAVGASASASGTSSAPSSGGSSPSPTSGGTTTTGTTTTGTTTTGGNGSGTPGSGGKTPPPAGLTARQSYAVKLAISNSSGGINTLDPLQRLSVLPSTHQPLMLELGVLKGGNRVLFALEPGTIVSGPGECVPGPIDCQIVSVARNQVEHVGVQSKSGTVPVDMFAVTGISVVTHSSAAAAQRARQDESAAGRALLSRTSLSALSLFHYEPSVGAVVDMRNLTFGVNS